MVSTSQCGELAGATAVVCTIAARNYLAHVRVLAQSLRLFHPQMLLQALVVDGEKDELPAEVGIEFLYVEEIGLPPREALRMAAIYDRVEFSTAVKPWLLRYLQRREASPVIYLDPDIEVFGPLDGIAELARRHSIVLTPHLTAPLPEDNLNLSEDAILGAGIYNLGFLAVGSDSEEFLNWWSGKVKRQCLIDTKRMRFTDQRWVDLVPGLYRHYILRDDNCNVAYWNLHSRRLTWTDRGYRINGQPLLFFHYSGYDPAHPQLLSRHQGGRPRIKLSEHPGVERLCYEYRDKLLKVGWEDATRQRYRYAWLANGLPIDRYVRQAYREALLAFDEGRGPEPPNPFRFDESAAFIDWLKQPPANCPPNITRYALTIRRATPDAQAAFPWPLGPDAGRFIEWCLGHAGKMGTRVEFLRAPARSGDAGMRSAGSSCDQVSRQSVTVAGYLTAELGVGEAARLVIEGLRQADVLVCTEIVCTTVSRRNHPAPKSKPGEWESQINIFCVNADATPALMNSLPPRLTRNRSAIGFWFWEIEEFPEEMHGAFDLVDEVWVSSEFTRQTLLHVSPKPVYKFALPRPEAGYIHPQSRAVARSDGDTFQFLFCFDCLSVMPRKNPDGLVEAFREAFPSEHEARLLIKSINGDHQTAEMERLRYLARGRRDITIQDGYLTAEEKNALIRSCDAYVSLHRAEGYGLTMAEAMAMGKPVIATQYSGNLEYMTQENSFLCPFEYREVGPGCLPYPSTARWAEPDLSAAARLMRQVFYDRNEAARRGRQAAHDMQTLYSPKRCGEAMRRRLEVIRQERCLEDGSC